MDVVQDDLMAFPGIGEDFADGEIGEAHVQVLEAWDGLQVVVAVGEGEGAGDRPEGEEAVIDDIEGFGFVAEVMFPARDAGFLVFFGSIRIGSARLVSARVIIIPNSG